MRDGKAERLRVWMSGLRRDQYGDGRVIVATNALGLGIDVPDIRVVLHIEMPFEMADYAQQSGRAGRDGLRSEAIIVRVDIKGVPGRQRPLVVEDAATDDYISGRVCRRVIIDSVMDGRIDWDGCEEGEELCDICQVRSEVVDLEELGISEDEEETGMRVRELVVQAARDRAITHAGTPTQPITMVVQTVSRELTVPGLHKSITDKLVSFTDGRTELSGQEEADIRGWKDWLGSSCNYTKRKWAMQYIGDAWRANPVLCLEQVVEQKELAGYLTNNGGGRAESFTSTPIADVRMEDADMENIYPYQNVTEQVDDDYW
ncbi:hypothetical protein AUP68_10344, partial [Ilyonectria robusta]